MNQQRPVSKGFRVLVLQHPQEARRQKRQNDGTVTLLQNANIPGVSISVKVGLSWPNLARALGETSAPAEWGVLYLPKSLKKLASENPEFAPRHDRFGTEVPHTGASSTGKRPGSNPKLESGMYLYTKGQGLTRFSPRATPVRGIILLDGNWQQAKNIWWRNPWLTRVRQLVLIPDAPSRFNTIRREPRRECLSTLETALLALKNLGVSAEKLAPAEQAFSEFLNAFSKRPSNADSASQPGLSKRIQTSQVQDDDATDRFSDDLTADVDLPRSS